MNIELKNGDCLDLMKDILDKSIDMILCDLPYGITNCKWDIVIPFEKLWEQYNRIIKDNGCIALFGTEPFSSYLRISNIKNYKYDWVWDKITARGHLVAKIRPMQKNECISIFGKKKINYYPIMIKRPKDKIEIGKEYKRSDLIFGGKKKHEYIKQYTQWYPKTILEFSNASNKHLHPTEKPVPLLEYLIKTYTLENETVLDNCMGSGSTGIACIHLNRNFIGYELNKDYFDIAQNRINKELNESL
jgi:site-specific DNA-methyltransferase (adenine-specific)